MSASDDALVAWLTARIEQAKREAPHAHERGCFAWDDYHYRHGRDVNDPQPTAGDACECSGPLRAMARVAAERGVVAAYEAQRHARDRTYTDHVEYPPNEPWVATSQHLMEYAVRSLREQVKWIAYGHRFDAPGLEPTWVPRDAKATT